MLNVSQLVWLKKEWKFNDISSDVNVHNTLLLIYFDIQQRLLKMVSIMEQYTENLVMCRFLVMPGFEPF